MASNPYEGGLHSNKQVQHGIRRVASSSVTSAEDHGIPNPAENYGIPDHSGIGTFML